MPFIAEKVADDPEGSKYYIGFPKGLNTIQDKTLVDDKHLTLADNAMISVDGITRRYGTKKQFDQASATKIYGSFPFYKKSDGSRKFIRIGNGRLQYLNGSVWTNVSSQSYSNLNTEFIQAANKVFIHNGTDPMTYYDGSSITTYTAIADPGAPSVTPQGSAGSTAYSYKIVAFSQTGQTAVSTAGTTSTGNAILSTTNYNALSWSAVSGAVGYMVYGRKTGGVGECYMATVYTNSYNDTGSDSPATTLTPPTDNTTGGIKAKYACFTGGRQFVAGVTEGSTYYPTRLYYSGTINNIDTFNSSALGGGWVEIFSNDGGEIVGIKAFNDGVIVLKTNGIFKFYFTSSGLPALQEVTRAHGGVSHRAIQAVDNDLIFIGQKENRIAVWTLGTQANYASDQLRTNEVSVFITDSLSDINRAKLGNVCSFYYDNKFGFAYTRGANTENDTGFVLDTRFGGWVHWDGDPMKANHYTVYDDGANARLYGGSNSDGYMIEMMRSQRDDSGVAFRTAIGTKFINLGVFDVEKLWRNPTLWFKYIAGGTISAEVWLDGTKYAGAAPLASTSGGAGVGIDLMGSFYAGVNYSTVTMQTPNADVIKQLTLIKFSKSIGFYIIDTNVDSNWLFQGYHLIYSTLEGKPPKSNERVTLTT